jgi:hypothetical protein
MGLLRSDGCQHNQRNPFERVAWTFDGPTGGIAHRGNLGQRVLFAEQMRTLRISTLAFRMVKVAYVCLNLPSKHNRYCFCTFSAPLNICSRVNLA